MQKIVKTNLLFLQNAAKRKTVMMVNVCVEKHRENIYKKRKKKQKKNNDCKCYFEYVTARNKTLPLKCLKYTKTIK